MKYPIEMACIIDDDDSIPLQLFGLFEKLAAARKKLENNI